MDLKNLSDEILTERRHQVTLGYTEDKDRRKGSYRVAAEASNRLSELLFKIDKASLRDERHDLIQIMTILASAIHTIDYHEARSPKSSREPLEDSADAAWGPDSPSL